MNNGYTQIKIDGVAVGLKFAYPAIKWFTEASLTPAGKELYFTQTEKPEESSFTVEGLAKLIECSYKNNCLIKEVEPSIPYEKFYDYVEAAQQPGEEQTEVLKTLEVYAGSTVMKKVIEYQKKSQITSL